MDKDTARTHLERWGQYMGSSDTPAAITAVLCAWADAERQLDELRAKADTEWGCERQSGTVIPWRTERAARRDLRPDETLMQRDIYAPGPWRPAP